VPFFVACDRSKDISPLEVYIIFFTPDSGSLMLQPTYVNHPPKCLNHSFTHPKNWNVNRILDLVCVVR